MLFHFHGGAYDGGTHEIHDHVERCAIPILLHDGFGSLVYTRMGDRMIYSHTEPPYFRDHPHPDDEHDEPDPD